MTPIDQALIIATVVFVLACGVLLVFAVAICRHIYLSDPPPAPNAPKRNRWPMPWRAIAAWGRQRYLAIVWAAFQSSAAMKAFQAGVTITLEANQPLLTQAHVMADGLERRMKAAEASRLIDLQRAYAVGYDEGVRASVVGVSFRARRGSAFLSVN